MLSSWRALHHLKDTGILEKIGPDRYPGCASCQIANPIHRHFPARECKYVLSGAFLDSRVCAIFKLWLTYVRSGSLLSFLKPQAVAQVLLQFLGTEKIVKCKIEIVTQISSTTLGITKLVAITGHWRTSSSIHTNREKKQTL